MAKIYLIDKDTAKALSYIEKGKLIFEDNMELINTEINIYLAQHKTDVLKTKLTDAIAISPDNEVLHCVLGNLYVQTKDNENAEKEFQKAIEIKPDYDLANYNLGVIYFNSGNDWGEKINALPMNDTKKAKEFEEKKNELYRKAVVNFEKSYEISPDKATKQRLRQLYLKLGETEKAEKYK
jgi:tetratricopeptide (TPR) repeat protein